MPDTADPTPAGKPDAKKKQLTHPRDPAREAVETIVFVVVLVLLLKLFVTEAFVIPTGSMAETLYGYQKLITCPKCGHEFPVNSHDEVEGRDGKRMRLVGYCCPNCRHKGEVEKLDPEPQNNTGDRVLVLKPLFHVRSPQRGDVVVFKFPDKPQEKFTAQNYIKRAMGFGGETVAIHNGDLYTTRSLEYPADEYPRPADPNDLWKPKYMYPHTSEGDNPRSWNLFEKSRGAGFPAGIGGFEIVRKEEEQVKADLRLVWDNDKQPSELAGRVPPRWSAPAGGWTADSEKQPKVFGHDLPDQHWVRYRHLAATWRSGPLGPLSDAGGMNDPTPLANQSPVPIDNFLGYNAGMYQDPATRRVEGRDTSGADRLWVGDLSVECKATLAAGAEVTLELSKGVNRFQAIFAEGKVTLARTGPGGDQFGNPSRPCKVSAGTLHTLQFANIDCRLWVWVDGRRIDFGAEGDYHPATPEQEAAFVDTEPDKDGKEAPRTIPGVQTEGWTRKNDVLAPVGIGAKGKVTVQNVKVMRDIYYTRKGSGGDNTKADIYYVQPGHYMCLGDNSAQSSDSRTWGTVPERLMLGKAVFVFWPAWPNNRIGFIK